MEKKKDLRVIKTKKMIYTALVELMKEKTFEEIKVSDICEKALINRSTFYAHYEDKYELLIDFIKDLKEEFSQKLENNKALNIKEYYLELIKIFLNHVEDKKDIYSSIMIHNRNSIMMDILLSAINDDILKRMPKLTDLMIKSFVDSRYFDRSYMINNLDNNGVENNECQNLLFKIDSYYEKSNINEESNRKIMS